MMCNEFYNMHIKGAVFICCFGLLTIGFVAGFDEQHSSRSNITSNEG